MLLRARWRQHDPPAGGCGGGRGSDCGGVTCASAVAGDYAYIGQGQDLVVLDMNNPASPTELGRLSTAGFVRDVVV
ncbi:MAG: hypothetical protein ACXQTY_07880 [Candidatus Methanogasteraceae archaeon]